MITSITPYLMFNGDCEEAMNFYVKALGGKIVNLMRVNDGPKEYHKPGFEKKIMHAQFAIGEATVLASDSMGHEMKTGDTTSLTLQFSDIAAIDSAWKQMSEGADITMDLQDTFWGARYGSLKDKFGINWMFNCENGKK